VAEVWFESEEDLIETMRSPEGQRLSAALLEDERNFFDHSKSSAFIVKEHEFQVAFQAIHRTLDTPTLR
jgi:hypothetical protein